MTTMTTMTAMTTMTMATTTMTMPMAHNGLSLYITTGSKLTWG